MAKYNLGDKVRIVKNLGEIIGVNPEGAMNHMAGEIMTIEYADTEDGKSMFIPSKYGLKYLMEENGWWWSDAMIEGLVVLCIFILAIVFIVSLIVDNWG